MTKAGRTARNAPGPSAMGVGSGAGFGSSRTFSREAMSPTFTLFPSSTRQFLAETSGGRGLWVDVREARACAAIPSTSSLQIVRRDQGGGGGDGEGRCGQYGGRTSPSQPITKVSYLLNDGAEGHPAAMGFVHEDGQARPCKPRPCTPRPSSQSPYCKSMKRETRYRLLTIGRYVVLLSIYFINKM